MSVSFVELDAAEPAEAVVVIDVLRAFTTVPWAYEVGAERVLAVSDVEQAFTLRAEQIPDAMLAGEQGGQPIEGFDLSNSPSELARRDLNGRTLIHRTSAGTQGLARTAGSGLVLAASFVTAAATAEALRSAGATDVCFVITGASLGRDGDEDLAAAELIAARFEGVDPEPQPYLDRVAPSDAGRMFTPDGPDWAPPADLVLACELDRFDRAFAATFLPEFGAVEVTPV